jgi:hypothetical protein
VVLSASRASDFVTGAAISVDGGFSVMGKGSKAGEPLSPIPRHTKKPRTMPGLLKFKYREDQYLATTGEAQPNL